MEVHGSGTTTERRTLEINDLLSNRGQVILTLYSTKELLYSKKIAKFLNISEMTVAKHLRELKNEGYVVSHEAYGNAIPYSITKEGRDFVKEEIKSIVGREVLSKYEKIQNNGTDLAYVKF